MDKEGGGGGESCAIRLQKLASTVVLEEQKKVENRGFIDKN